LNGFLWKIILEYHCECDCWIESYPKNFENRQSRVNLAWIIII
jgi:hypothetical protein